MPGRSSRPSATASDSRRSERSRRSDPSATATTTPWPRTVNGYYKAELIRGPARSGPWKTIEEVELATLGWVHWHNTQRLHGYLGDLPPAEFEALHAARQALDSGVLSVGWPARRAAERLPQPHLDAVEREITSEPLLEAPPTTATALTADAPMPEDAPRGQNHG